MRVFVTRKEKKMHIFYSSNIQNAINMHNTLLINII